MVIIGLGTNKGDRKAMLDTACAALGSLLADIRRSSILETPALLPDNAPAEWDMPFLNMAVVGETSLLPPALLVELHAIEKSLGRIDRGRWGPREIDLDILVMDDLVFEHDHLSVPHKALLMRDFALKPLAELAPDWRYPVAGEHYGKTARELAVGL